jgi:Ca2+-transporting ATPase
MKYNEKTLWHTLSIDETITILNTDPEHGLSHDEAAQRLKYFGYNELAEVPPPTFWEMLWEQFNNFVIWMLIAAALISAFLGDYLEAAAIAAIVILNAVLGVIQERNAQNALASLKKLAAPETTVLRSGSRITIPAREVVPGDIVFLEAGNYIPADLRLIETMNLRVEEAALTGESVPVQKDARSTIDANANIGDRKNMGFMGTIVSYGRGIGIVTSTGMRTQIGHIAELLQAVEEEETPLQRRLNQLGKTLGVAAMIICGIVFIVGMIQGNDPLNMFIVAVSLAVAAVPEGLPAVVTISLALGMREMIKRHALIRRLASVETLGSATVICSDKTGTFTQNQMTVTHIWIDGNTYTVTGSGYHPEGKFHLNGNEINILAHPALRETLWISALNNDSVLEESIKDNGSMKSYRMVGDPTEGSLLVAATKAGMYYKDLKSAYPRIAEIPFDSNRKRMVTVHTQAKVPEHLAKLICRDFNNCHIITVKGAADLVLNLCSSILTSQGDILPLTDEKRREILLANDEMSKQALRVLAIAYKQHENEILPENQEMWKRTWFSAV